MSNSPFHYTIVAGTCLTDVCRRFFRALIAFNQLQLSLLRINEAGRPVSIGDIVATVEPEPDVVSCLCPVWQWICACIRSLSWKPKNFPLFIYSFDLVHLTTGSEPELPMAQGLLDGRGMCCLCASMTHQTRAWIGAHRCQGTSGSGCALQRMLA